MVTETHKFWGTRHEVIDGIFSWPCGKDRKLPLKFNVRSGSQGESDVGIIRNCTDRDEYSYWHLGETYTGVIIDVGAHIGGFTCDVASTAKKVFAYEASTENYKLLVSNVRLNNWENVECFQAVAGTGDPGHITFCQNRSTSPSTLRTDGRATEEVTGISLATMLERVGEEVELMKLDCEGGEYDLFIGQPRDLVRKIKMIASEVHLHDDYTHDEFVEFIEANGYRSEAHKSRANSCRMVDFWRIDG